MYKNSAEVDVQEFPSFCESTFLILLYYYVSAHVTRLSPAGIIGTATTGQLRYGRTFQFMGTWYEVQRTPFLMETMIRCNKFHYQDKGDSEEGIIVYMKGNRQS